MTSADEFTAGLIEVVRADPLDVQMGVPATWVDDWNDPAMDVYNRTPDAACPLMGRLVAVVLAFAAGVAVGWVVWG